MGLENREYYRDEQQYSAFGAYAGASRSIVATIILINVAVFVVAMFITELTSFLALKPYEAHLPWYWWQFITYGFVHAPVQGEGPGIFHIIGNMLIVFFLGRPLEVRLGRLEFLKFYLIALLVSGLAIFLYHRAFTDLGANPQFKVYGASGAASAIIGLFVCVYPKQTLLLFGVIPMPAWLLGLLIVLGDLRNLHFLNPESEIAAEAHFAGLIFGAVYHFAKLNFAWLKFDWMSDRLKGKPSLKIHRPTRDDQLKEQADAVLEKIAEQGESSLTAKERRILKKYSASIRNKRD